MRPWRRRVGGGYSHHGVRSELAQVLGHRAEGCPCGDDVVDHEYAASRQRPRLTRAVAPQRWTARPVTGAAARERRSPPPFEVLDDGDREAPRYDTRQQCAVVEAPLAHVRGVRRRPGDNVDGLGPDKVGHAAAEPNAARPLVSVLQAGHQLAAGPRICEQRRAAIDAGNARYRTGGAHRREARRARNLPGSPTYGTAPAEQHEATLRTGCNNAACPKLRPWHRWYRASPLKTC
jgi:hypothetical protein